MDLSFGWMLVVVESITFTAMYPIKMSEINMVGLSDECCCYLGDEQALMSEVYLSLYPHFH